MTVARVVEVTIQSPRVSAAASWFDTLEAGDWTFRAKPAFGPRDNSGWVKAACRQRDGHIFLFGPDSQGTSDGVDQWPSSNGYANDLWELDPAANTWTLHYAGKGMDDASQYADPVPVGGHTYGGWCVDQVRGWCVKYGGQNRTGSFNHLKRYLATALGTSGWADLIAEETGCPTPTFGPWTHPIYVGGTAMAYDEGRDEYVNVSGYHKSICGTYSDQDVTEVMTPAGGYAHYAPTPRPPSRTGAALAYDMLRSRIWLHGGDTSAGNTARNDLWWWNGATHTWTQVTPSGTPPAAGGGKGFAYDTLHDRFLVIGGRPNLDAGTIDTVTHIYDPVANAWSQPGPTTTPANLTIYTSLVYLRPYHAFALFANGGMYYYRIA